MGHPTQSFNKCGGGGGGGGGAPFEVYNVRLRLNIRQRHRTAREGCAGQIEFDPLFTPCASVTTPEILS